MATLTRRPLSTKSSLPQLNEPRLLVAPTSLKRSRSPEPSTASQPPAKNAKRVRSLQGPIVAAPEDAKSKKKSEREQQKAEFREKYTKAFPSWIFYFDPDTTEVANAHLLKEELERKICLLGGRVEDFFSKDVTHLITDLTLPASTAPSSNKENIGRSKGSAALASLRSPIKLRVRPAEESANSLLAKAQSFGQKIWTIAKLSSVVDRCLSIPSEKPATSTTTSAASLQPSLSRLLQSERLNGTCERDPAERRHDYRYFPKDSYFVLVEDLRQEYATIAVQEYPIPKPNSSSKPSWPILHCHPNSRNPFVEFDEKEKRRWEKAQQAEAAKREDGPIPRKKVKMTQVENLRRTVSMNSLRRHASNPNDMFRENNLVDLDGDDDDHNGSNYASGYLLSGALGHAAASGNSVTLTSTTGTTSTTSTRSAMQLSAPLRNRLQQHITTSKKFPCGGRSTSVNMGPPDAVPRAAMLRKSKSTNTMRLPKRDEGMKPGYCESCRSKFDDFRKHVQSTKHKRFAANDDNFLQLDYTLTRVKRRTLEEVKNNQAKILRRQYAVGDS